MSYELEIDLKRIYNYFFSLNNFFKMLVLLRSMDRGGKYKFTKYRNRSIRFTISYTNRRDKQKMDGLLIHSKYAKFYSREKVN